MTNKRILISMSFFIMLIMSVSSVSAADNLTDNSSFYDNSSLFASSDIGNSQNTNGLDDALLNSSNEVYVSVNGSDDLGDGSIDNPYATIAYGIGRTSSGGILNVFDGNYPIDSPIIIDRDITINGFGKNILIDGQNKTRLLSFQSFSTFSMNNIILANGFADNGAVADVSNLDKTVSFNGCSFINNSAKNHGGVFYSSGNPNMDEILTVKSSLFSGNTADRGGVFYGTGMLALYLSNSFVINCTDIPYYTNNGRMVTINNNYWGVSSPKNSYLKDDYLGNIEVNSWYMPVIVSDSEVNMGGILSLTIKFVNSNLKDISGRINLPSIKLDFIVDLGTLLSSDSYISHNASALIRPAGSGTMTIYAVLEGGEILNKTVRVNALPLYASADATEGSGDGSLDNPYTLSEAINRLNTDSLFDSLELLDGVYNSSDLLSIKSDITVKPYSNGNVVISGLNTHGIFSIDENLSVNIFNITFINGNATNGGGIFLGKNSNLTVISSVFKYNNAENGGAIYADENSNLNVTYSQFSKNTAVKASEIYTENTANAYVDSNWWGQNMGPYINNMVYGRIFLNRYMTINMVTNKTILRPGERDNINVYLGFNDSGKLNNYMKDLPVEIQTDNAVIIPDEFSLSFENNYTAMAVISRISDNVNGNLIADNEILNFTYELFTPLDIAYVSTDGDDLNGDGTEENPFLTISKALENVNKEDSLVYIKKGHYYLNSEMDIDNMNITITSYDGQVYLDRTNAYDVFRISNDSSLTLNKLIFINGKNNFALNSAIHNKGKLFVNSVLFTENIGGGFGAYIFNDNGNVEIYNSNFTNSKTFAGQSSAAIYTSKGYVYIDNCRFTDNGLAYNTTDIPSLDSTALRNNNGTMVVNNSYFNNSYGPVLFNYNLGNTTLNNSLISNTSYYTALNIAPKSKIVYINNCDFISNKAGSVGVERNYFVKDNIVYIDDSRFINNTGVNGGAIYNQFAEFIINGCVFINNTGVNGGAIYANHSAMEVYDSVFINNTGRNRGGSIYTAGSDDIVIIGNNFFNNTKAETGGAIYSNGITTVYGNRIYNPTAETGKYIYNDNRIGNTYLKILNNSTVLRTMGNVIIYATLTDDRGNPISGGKITLKIDGKNYTATSKEGRVSFSHVFNKKGEYLITGNYDGSRRYITIVSTSIIQIVNSIRKQTLIEASNLTQYAVDFNNGERGGYFNVTLKDIDGKPLAGKKISIGFNGAVYNRTTDNNGLATLQINLQYPGIYTFAISFLSDSSYNGSFLVRKITINKKISKLTISSVKYSLNSKNKKITIKLQGTNYNGKSYVTAKGRNIKLTVNGKTYYGKTNSGGISTIAVSLNKKGTYVVVTRFNGDYMFNSKSSTSRITVS